MSDGLRELLNAETLIDSLNDGVYATDRDRRIVYWSKSAERITGWPREEVEGRTCWDNVLMHTDKEGRRLCGEDSCPMHRSILTGEHSTVPVTVYATGKQGRRIPMQVSVAPIIDGRGDVLGAVEVFRDLTRSISDMTRARLIQNNAMSQELPEDPRVQFAVHCVPMDIVGGDFYRIERIDDDRFCFMLADVMGHGMAGALYTMQIRSLWEEFRALLGDPAAFVTALNRHLYPLIHDSKSFASALYGVLDLTAGTIELVRAGHPSPFVFRADGSPMRFERGAVALGLLPQFEYVGEVMSVETGDCVFAFTDCAFEVENKAGEELGIEGFERILVQAGYPKYEVVHKELEKRLLAYCHELYLPDDLTFLEFRLR